MTLAPTYKNRQLPKTVSNDGEESSYVQAFGKIFYLLGRILFLPILLGLVLVAGLVWIWLISFRSGWRFWTWLDEQSNNQQKLSLNLIYSLIVGLLSPLAIFANWSQKVITEKFQIQFPPQIDWRQVVEKQLGIKLPGNFPFLPNSKTDTQNPLVISKDSK